MTTICRALSLLSLLGTFGTVGALEAGTIGHLHALFMGLAFVLAFGLFARMGGMMYSDYAYTPDEYKRWHEAEQWEE